MGSSTQSNNRPVIPNGYRIRKVTDGNGVELFYPEVKRRYFPWVGVCWEPVRYRLICCDFKLPTAFTSLNDSILECRANVLTTEYIYE